jgi:peroxiredoxin
MARRQLTVLTSNGAAEVAAEVGDDGVWLEPDAVLAAIGWEVKPEGLCRGDQCVPVHDTTARDADGRCELGRVAAALGRPFAVELGVADAPVAAVGDASWERRAVLAGGAAPAVTLPDLDGEPVVVPAGRKRLVLTWSSWCGCRHELSAWQRLHDELGPLGLDIITVALDDGTEAVRPWAEAADPALTSVPVLVDTDHLLAEAYGITNVPSSVWIDEDDKVVKPPTITPGDNQFKDFTLIDADLHHEALRRWVRDGALPEAGEGVPSSALTARPPTEDEQQARTERRLASWLHRSGHDDLARAHYERAVELAPMDWTISRGSMNALGQDPFGTEFFELWETWNAAGRPDYLGLDRLRPADER